MFARLLAVCLSVPLFVDASRPKNAVLLSEVQSLTLRGYGAKTSHRRAATIPQLKCVSSRDLCKLYEIDVMRCTNQGSSYGDEDIEWSCTATLPEGLKLGGTDVICEGFSGPDDPYVLKGSCGVEYRLLLTAKGEARYPGSHSSPSGFFSQDSGEIDWSAWLFAVVFVAILAWILYSACFCNGSQRRQPRVGLGGGGGGGWNPGWGPGNDPPPPYPGTKPHSNQTRRWSPGFWSGVLGGAAAGYMAGGRNRSDDRPRTYANNWDRTSFSLSSSGPSSEPSTRSSARHESTGFGSTRRR